MTKAIYLAGHSGETWDRYWTAGKRGPLFNEGAFNRRVCDYAADCEPDCLFLNPGAFPLTLDDRILFINKIVDHVETKLKDDVVLIEVHANAQGDGRQWTQANGHTVFTTKNPSDTSQLLAKLINKQMRFQTPLRDRGIKQKSFKVIKKVKCPAVLVECGFMTNERDAKFLWTDGGHDKCGSALWKAWDLLNHQAVY